MPALDANKSASRSGVKKSHVKKYSLPSGPRGDAPATRKQDFKKAATFKKTPTYRHAIKAAYKAQPVERRRAIVDHILTKPKHARTPEDKAVLDTHSKRALRDRKQMLSQAFTDRQHAIVEKYKATPSYRKALADAAKTREKPKESASDIYETDPAKLKALGFHVDHSKLNSIVSAPKYALGALGSGAAVVEATYHDPIGVPAKTAKQGLKALPAIPGGLLDLATHPVKTVKEQAHEFAQRGGQSYKDRVKTIRKEGGLQYAGDAAAVIGGSSAASKLGLRTAKGDVLHVAARPAERLSGGVVRTPKERGLLAESVGRGMQLRRAKQHEKALVEAEAGGKPVDALVHQAALANREAGRVVETVAPRAARKQTRLVAKQRSRAIYGFKSNQGRRLKVDRKAIHTLSAKEKKAFYYATTFGIRDAAQARHVLGNLQSDILKNRKLDKVEVTGSLKKSDMLPDITAMLHAPEEYFTSKLGDVVEGRRADAELAAAEDPSLTPDIVHQRLHAPLAAALRMERGVKHELTTPTFERRSSVGKFDGPDRRVTEIVPGQSVAQAVAAAHRVPELKYFDESDVDFAHRVAKHADSLGLAKPIFFKSERYVGPRDFGTYALGGKRAMAYDKRYKGQNLRHGLQDTSPEQFLRGKGRNIKRAHNWNLVDNIFSTNRIESLSPPEGTTVSAINEKLAAAGIDHNSVALVNPGVYRKLALDPSAASTGERFAADHEFEQAQVAAAVDRSAIRQDANGNWVDGTKTVIPPGELAKTSGWHAVPVAVLRELEAQMVPSSKAGRMWDIAKGKASRAILLTGNVPWLGFQAVSDAAMSAVTTGGRSLSPKNWLDAHTWWKHDLTPEQRDRVGAQLGLDATGADSHQIKLGATANSDMVNWYRAIKAHPFWHSPITRPLDYVLPDRPHGGHAPSISQLNPLELMAGFDRKRTNAMRILTGYSLAKRDTVRRMGDAMGRADRTQTRLNSILSKPPSEQLRALADDPHVMEDHADAITDWMGDYTTMTAFERKKLNRLAMFYPYLRYSLKLMFYTLPVKHPAVTAVLGELGAMRQDELEKLFGKEGLPWNLGKIYFGHDGNVKSIDLKRANPALNALIDAASNGKPSQLVGIAPPWFGWAFDQLAQESSFAGRDWRVHGKAAPYGGPHLRVTDPARLKILADDILGLTYPYRTAETLTQRGAQGDDSTLWDEQRLHFKGTDTLSKLNRKFGEQRTNFEQTHESLINELIPLLPQADNSATEARHDAIIKRATPKPGKKKSKAKYFGGGSSGSHYFGAKP